MLAITIRKIGKYEVVVSVEQPPIEPEATKARLAKAMLETDESKKLQALANENIKLEQDAAAACHEHRRARGTSAKGEATRKYQQCRAEQDRVAGKLKAAALEYDAKRKAEFYNCMEFSAPRNAVLVDVEEGNKLSDALKACKSTDHILRDGSVISHEDHETERVSHLSDDQKSTEANELYQCLTYEALRKKDEWAVQSVADPLKKAQGWLKEQDKKVGGLYGIERREN